MTFWTERLTPFRALGRQHRLKAGLLFAWFFLTIATLWLLKPVRTASLLANLGAHETPYVRLVSLAVVAAVVALYSRIASRLSRRNLMLAVTAAFALVLLGFWLAIQLGGQALGGRRPFVWAVYSLVEVYSTVMVGIFWTYTNDVVTPDEANTLYGPIGLGGILGGIAGGLFVDRLAETIGTLHFLLVCAGLVCGCGAMAALTEHWVHPPPRQHNGRADRGLAAAIEGAQEVLRSPYLLLLVGIVVGYEFAATLTDFVINIVFERSFHGQAEIAKMYGRLGWIVSTTAIVSQLVLVPLLLPNKRIALLLPPVAMTLAALGLAALPVVSMAFVLAASDRGLNYSLQQSAKETLYVPLSDVQKYKAKAFIDMFVDRAAKAAAALTIIVVMARAGLSIRASLAVAVLALILWLACAAVLGRWYHRKQKESEAAPPVPFVPAVPTD